jgi:hypothetical protein
MDWDRFTDDDLVGAASAEVRHDGVASGVQAQTLSLLCPRPPHPTPPSPPSRLKTLWFVTVFSKGMSFSLRPRRSCRCCATAGRACCRSRGATARARCSRSRGSPAPTSRSRARRARRQARRRGPSATQLHRFRAARAPIRMAPAAYPDSNGSSGGPRFEWLQRRVPIRMAPAACPAHPARTVTHTRPPRLVQRAASRSGAPPAGSDCGHAERADAADFTNLAEAGQGQEACVDVLAVGGWFRAPRAPRPAPRAPRPAPLRALPAFLFAASAPQRDS